MRSIVTPRSAAVLLAACAALLSACGPGKNLLSPGDSATLNQTLGNVDAAVAAGDCPTAAEASARLKAEVANLPASIDSGLRDSLSQGASTVSRLAIRDCKGLTTSTTTSQATTSTSPTTSSSTSTSTSTSTSSQTTSSSTQTTTTTPTTTSTNGGGASPN